MKISYSIAKSTEYKDFYEVFIKNLKNQFPEYSKNSLSFLTEGDWSWKTVNSNLINKKKMSFLAINENREIAGYLLFSKNYGGVSLANWLAVDEKYQRQGIATNLLKMWEEDALKNGAHALQIWTVEKNRSFYKKRGFKESGELPSFWFGIDHYLFYKIIGKPIEKNYLRDFLKRK